MVEHLLSMWEALRSISGTTESKNILLKQFFCMSDYQFAVQLGSFSDLKIYLLIMYHGDHAIWYSISGFQGHRGNSMWCVCVYVCAIHLYRDLLYRISSQNHGA